MTLQRSGEGTASYTPPSLPGSAPDVFGLARPVQQVNAAEPRSAPRFTTAKLDKEGNYYYWRVELYDVRGGLNLQRGLFSEGHDRLASSTLDGRFPKNLTLPFLRTVASTPTTARDVSMRGLFGVNVGGILAIAAGAATSGAGDGPVLFKETSATDPTIASITYNPGSSISRPRSAQAIVIGGVSNNPKFAVGYSDLAVKVYSDLAGTVAGTMHSSTTGCDGIIQTPINDNTLLIYAGAILTLAASSAISDAPTSALANVPGGGWAMGMLSLGGGPIRAWWVWPDSNVTPTFSGPPPLFPGVRYRVMSTNLQGTDPQELKIPGLINVHGADLYRDGIFITDGFRAMHHNGRTIKDLFYNRDRNVTSGSKRYICGFWIKAGELYVRTVTEGNSADITWCIEHYDWDLGAWQQVSATFTETSVTTATGTLFHSGKSMPVSEQTDFLHTYIVGTGWHRQFQPRANENPYSYRKTSDGSVATGQQFATSGIATWPAMQIPGLEGWAYAVRRISGNPQIDIGGGTPTTYPSVAVSCGGVSATFVYGHTQGRQEFQFFDNENVAYELQPVITLTQQGGGTDPTRTTPQALPIVIEGIARRPEFSMGSDISDWTR